jgi:hypothetical protein
MFKSETLGPITRRHDLVDEDKIKRWKQRLTGVSRRVKTHPSANGHLSAQQYHERRLATLVDQAEGV